MALLGVRKLPIHHAVMGEIVGLWSRRAAIPDPTISWVATRLIALYASVSPGFFLVGFYATQSLHRALMRCLIFALFFHLVRFVTRI